MTRGRRPGGGPDRRAALGPLVAAALLLPQAAPAQEAVLPLVSLDLSQGVEARTEDGESGLEAVTALDFGFLDATPTQRLSLDARGSLRLATGGDGGEEGLDGPVLSFSYGRQGADASLALEGSARRDEVAFLDDLSDFVGEDGVIVLPEDFEDLEGTGTRRELSFGAVLNLRETAPLGVTLSVGVTDLAYEDTSSPDLRDSGRLRLGAGLRLSLGGSRTITAGLRYGRFEEDGSDPTESLGLDIGAGADRPLGAISAQLSFDDTVDGTRAALSLGRDLAFPTGALSGSLGLAIGANGDLLPTASLALRRDGPRSSVGLSAAQAFRSGDDDEEEAVTTLTAGLTRELTPRVGVSLDALYADTRATGDGGQDARELSLGATASYALSADWSVQGGLRQSLRDEDDSDGASSRTDTGTLFLGLSRRFEGTF